MSARDRHADELLTMALAARRKRSTKYAQAAQPDRPLPTPEQEAANDILKSLTVKGLKLLRRYVREFQELDDNGELYVAGAQSRTLPSPLPPRRDQVK
ncbi:MAG: hypothetical protein NW206_15995 [Hyphomonadaceae bacterium]|nr:hypothetical protein [Hyphomonadaceae bacterium]